MNMVIDRHLRSCREQYWYDSVVLEEFLEITDHRSLSICEVGPGEGGALKYFTEKGHYCYGLEFSEIRYKNSKILNNDSNIEFYKGDITKQDTYLQQIMSIMDNYHLQRCY